MKKAAPWGGLMHRGWAGARAGERVPGAEGLRAWP
ncbi:MAG: hypothetical protein RL722_2984 [Pseudomonadota bacterium]|jgi:hypothetical protein